MFHDIEQNTDIWTQLRTGLITSSALPKAMANYGKSFGEPAKKYAVDIALEQITGIPAGNYYSNGHMDRGHEEEPLARMAYEDQFFCDVANGGFFELDDVGCSPDGLVGDDGLIEIKSAIPSIHFARIKSQSFDSAYKWQLAGNLKFTGREYIDFVSYCSSFPAELQLYVYRCHKADFDKEFKMIDVRLNEFRALIKETKQTILNNEYLLLERKEHEQRS